MTFSIAENKAHLGFGCMRLPLRKQGCEECVDVDQVAEMIDMFLSAGFTYFDTARGYHGGSGEGVLKRVLIDRYPRDSFEIASKLPAYLAPDARTARQMFFVSLEDTQAGFFDSYLLHNMGGKRTEYFEQYGIWEFLQEQKKEGLISELGFSFHGSAQELEEIIFEHPFIDFVQLQINYADWESDLVQSRKCYEVARSFDLPVVVMEPVKGGLLADPPPSVLQVLQDANPQESPVSWALRFAASLEGVGTVLSGMSTIDQMSENIKIMKNVKPLSDQEWKVASKAQETLKELPLIACTSCGYCKEVCRQHIEIPIVLSALNTLSLYGDIKKAQDSYLWAGEGKASLCLSCHACEAVCPQGIVIVESMKEASSALEVYGTNA